MKFRRPSKNERKKAKMEIKKIPAIYDWIPFLTGFIFALLWIFTLFYGMDYSGAFFSKGAAAGEIPASGWFKLFIPMGLLGLFFLICFIINRLKENIHRKNLLKLRKNVIKQ